jgi:hypothetical protein
MQYNLHIFKQVSVLLSSNYKHVALHSFHRLRFQLSAFHDAYFSLRAAALASHGLDFLNDIKPVEHFTEDDMASIEPAGGYSGDKELRTVRVWPGIGHAYVARGRMSDAEIFIRELSTVDTLPTSAITRSKITALNLHQQSVRNEFKMIFL